MKTSTEFQVEAIMAAVDTYNALQRVDRLLVELRDAREHFLRLEKQWKAKKAMAEVSK